MDILQLYSDYGIQARTEGHKHCRPGWVNVECPFCTSQFSNPGYHLGATLDGKVFYCWRCGIHWPDESIAKLLNISRSQAKRLILEYAGTSQIKIGPQIKTIQTKAYKLPGNITDLSPAHKKYLEKRKFDPEYLEKEWGLVSTGPISLLESGGKKIDYGHRILAPIYWNGIQVTFQARDVTNKHPLKYMACPKDRELIHHKHILYRHPNEKSKIGICVEGITDVWRFGRKSFATFGIEFTPTQIRLISLIYEKVGVCYDGNEFAALRQANKLISELRFRKVDAFRIDIAGDPGDMNQLEAEYLIKQYL